MQSRQSVWEPLVILHQPPKARCPCEIPLRTLAFDDRAAEEYGIIRADLERAGTPIGPNGLLISALVRSHDLTLVNLNRREFGRVAGLRLTDFEGSA